MKQQVYDTFLALCCLIGEEGVGFIFYETLLEIRRKLNVGSIYWHPN